MSAPPPAKSSGAATAAPIANRVRSFGSNSSIRSRGSVASSQRTGSQDYGDEALDTVALDESLEEEAGRQFIPDACYFSPSFRPDQVGRVDEETKFSLAQLLEQRMPKSTFEKQFASRSLADQQQQQQYNEANGGAPPRHPPTIVRQGSLASRGIALSQLLSQRPSKQRLTSRNIIKDDDSKRSAAATKIQSTQQRLLAEQRKNKLNSLLERRSSVDALQKQNILPVPQRNAAQLERKSSAKLALDGLLAGNRPTPETLLKQRIITDIGDLPSNSHGATSPTGSAISPPSGGSGSASGALSSRLMTSPRRDDDQHSLRRVDRLAHRHIKSVACGFAHTMALDAQGQVHVFGSASNGRLGLGSPQQLAADGEDAATTASHDDGSIVVNAALAQFGKVTSLACGDAHSAAVIDGKAYTWGAGSWGRLGLGHVEDVSQPTQVRSSALENEIVVQVACGAYHTLILTQAGNVYACGWHKNGRCGLGKQHTSLSVQSPVRIPELQDILSIDAGQNSSLALTRGGQLFTWGAAASGVCGHADEVDVWSPKALQHASLAGQHVTHAAVGATHSVCATKQGALLTWGTNRACELARPDVERQALAPGRVDKFDASGTTHITCGKSHTLLIKNGQLFAWGTANRGVLALGDETTTKAAASAGAESASSPATSVSTTSDVSVPTRVTAGLESSRVAWAAASWAHTAIVTEQGALLTCGSRNDGKLGF